MITDNLPILYSFRRCPYAMRARMALGVSGRSVALREILLKDKPPSMIAVSPKATVPVLVLANGGVLEQSFDIMMWTLEQDDPQGWLKPQNGTLQDMKDLIAENDGRFKQHLDRYKYSVRYEDIDPIQNRAQGVVFLKDLNARLSNSPYLFGDKPSLADIAIFPFVRQFANVDRDWFDALPLSSLQTWLAGHLVSPLFAHAMQKWPVWAEGQVEPVFP